MQALRRATVALAMVLPLSACSIGLHGGSQTGKAIDDVSSHPFAFGLMAIGQAKDLDFQRAEGMGVVRSPQLDAYLNEVLAKLAAQSPVRDVPAHVYVRAANEWGAMATPDADIYVNIATLQSLDSEDEIAALLGHELSHVLLRHTDSDAIESVQRHALQLSSLAMSMRDQVNSSSSHGRAHRGGDDARVTEQAQALLLSSAVILPAWTREQENQADQLGLDLMVRAGYRPQAALDLLAKQDEVDKARQKSPQGQFLEQQIKALLMQSLGDASKKIDAVADRGSENQLLGGVVKKVLGDVADAGAHQLAQLQQGHVSAEERRTELQAYLGREYAGATAASTTPDGWPAVKSADEVADVLEGYANASEAMDRLFENDLRSAEKLARAGLIGPTKTHAYPNAVMAAVRQAQGRPRDALINYETALKGPEPAGRIFIEVSNFYAHAGNRSKAQELMEEGFRRFQEAPGLMPALIQTYRTTGKPLEAQKLMARCILQYPKLEALCGESESNPTAHAGRSS